MATFYFSTSSNANTPIKHLYADIELTANAFRGYSLPLEQVKVSYVHNGNKTASGTGDSSRLYIEDLNNQNTSIIVSTSDTLFINGVSVSPSPDNSIGLYNAFTSSGIF